jgi:uncharacterized protein
MPGFVERISIAPIKSLALVHPERVELGERGVDGDRRFWLVTPDGRLVNGHVYPQLMQVQPEWDEHSRRLALRFPGGEVVEGIVEPGEPFAAQLYGQDHPSRRVPGPWQDALCEFVEGPMTLLWSEAGASDRGDEGGWVSVVSRASLEKLAEVIGMDEPIDGRRFRMLFEIGGVEAHEEDTWIGSNVQLGPAVVSVGGDVGRCAITKRDPDTGVTDLDTLKGLARYRREGKTEPLPLGIHAAVAVPGPVAVGDAVAPAVAVRA